MAGRKHPGRSPSASGSGRTEILLEEIRAQNEATIDAVHALERRIDQRFHKVDEHFVVLDAAVRQNGADIRKNSADIQKNGADIRKNSADIQKNSADIQKNSADIRKNSADIRKNSADIQHLEARFDRFGNESLEERVSALERSQGAR